MLKETKLTEDRKMKNKVYVLGAVMTPMRGRWKNQTYWGLAQMATKALLEHMGLQFHMGLVDFASFGIYNDMFEGHAIPETFLVGPLGLHMCEVDRISTGGQTGLATTTRVYDAIASGRHKLGLALGVEKALDNFDPQSHSQTPAVIDTIAFSWPFWTQWPLGVTAASSYAQRIAAYRERFPKDLGMEARARFIEQVCKQGLVNPLAQRHPEVITADWVKDSRVIIDDIRLGEVCVYSEGAVAILLGDEDMAREWSKETGRPMIGVAGIGHACESTYVGREPPHMDLTIIESDKVAAERAYRMAGIGPKDIKVVGQHCAFGPQGLITLAMMGFAEPGHAQDLVLDGTMMDGGTLVVDPYGGLIYAGHAVGSSNMMSMLEVYNFLVAHPDAEFGAVHGTGGADAVYGGVTVLQQLAE